MSISLTACDQASCVPSHTWVCSIKNSTDSNRPTTYYYSHSTLKNITHTLEQVASNSRQTRTQVSATPPHLNSKSCAEVKGRLISVQILFSVDIRCYFFSSLRSMITLWMFSEQFKHFRIFQTRAKLRQCCNLDKSVVFKRI